MQLLRRKSQVQNRKYKYVLIIKTSKLVVVKNLKENGFNNVLFPVKKRERRRDKPKYNPSKKCRQKLEVVESI